MISADIQQELHRHLMTMPTEMQQQVLDYARTLTQTKPQGVKGSTLLAFAGIIPTTDLDQMQAAIETDCSQVDADGW